MALYDHIDKDGNYIETRDFAERPVIHVNKGRWVLNNPNDPRWSFDPRTQRRIKNPTTPSDDEVTYTVENRPLVDCKTDLKTAVTSLRYSIEVGGFTAGDAVIRTDRESQGLIGGAYAAAKNGVIESFDFKSATGWVTFPAADVIIIGEMVAQHVQACFSRERALHEAIDAAGDHNALLAIDINAGWPS